MSLTTTQNLSTHVRDYTDNGLSCAAGDKDRTQAAETDCTGDAVHDGARNDGWTVAVDKQGLRIPDNPALQ